MSLSRLSIALVLTAKQQTGNTQNTKSNPKTNKLALVETQKQIKNLIIKQFTCKNCSYECAQ